MKKSLVLFLFCGTTSYAQLSFQTVNDSTVRKYHIGASTYFNDFADHAGYGAIAIRTTDGGGAAFGDGDEGTMLIKLNKSGKVQWKTAIKPLGDESEPQCVAEDKNGNFYIYQLIYDRAKYRGGCERVVCVNKLGKVTWDKYLGVFSMINNPTVSYVKSLPDGRIYMRGHVALKKPTEGKDPEYRFWEGWINSIGTLTQKTGDVIDWSNSDWQKKFKPD